MSPAWKKACKVLSRRWSEAADRAGMRAWLLVQVTRNLGYAGRFVSGYLIQLADTERSVPGIEADSADLHAWAEIYLPGAGWLGFDATSGLMTGSGHIPLACSAHPASAAPVTGTVQ